jgi:hypothetical protein
VTLPSNASRKMKRNSSKTTFIRFIQGGASKRTTQNAGIIHESTDESKKMERTSDNKSQSSFIYDVHEY